MKGFTQIRRADEDLGRCIGCNRKLRVGEVVLVYEDEICHANCDRPASLDLAAMTIDDDCSEPVIMLGSPAIYYRLGNIGGGYAKGRADERADVLALLRRRQGNCGLVAARAGAEWEELGKDRERQLGIVIEDIAGGTHLCEGSGQ